MVMQWLLNAQLLFVVACVIQLLLQKERSIRHLRLGFPPEQSQQLVMPEKCWHSNTILIFKKHQYVLVSHTEMVEDSLQ